MKEEKVEFENSRGVKLVGALHVPDKETDKIIIFSHGFGANKERARIVKTAERICQKGFAALRFDFAGRGESRDDSLTIEKEIDDLKSAISFIKSKGYKDIGLVGESLGGLCSVLAYNEEIKAMVLWAPVLVARAPDLNEEQVKELQAKGYIIIDKDGRKFKVEKQYLTERETINQKEIFSKIKCPVLIMHGNKDDIIPIEDSKNALNYLPKGSKLEVIDGSGHKFTGHEDQLAEISSGWISKYL